MTGLADPTDPAVDVAIVGGGLVGASLALALRHTGHSVALIEAAVPAATAPAWDERCIALNDASRRIFEALGVWEALRPEAAAIVGTHISERGRFGVARFSAAEAGLDALGHNTPLRVLGAQLAAATRGQPRLRIFCPARVTALAVTARGATLTLAEGHTLAARLVVAADGAQSALRGLVGLGAAVSDYGQSAIVTAVRVQREALGTAFERFLASGPLAVLPKPRLAADDAPGHPCSLIWTLPTAEAEAMAERAEADFLAAAAAAFGERLGRFMALGRRAVYPLQRTMGEALTAPRLVFCGNAAQSLHPVAAQGFNLGLRDVAALAARLSAAQDPGAPEVLADYVAARSRDRERTAGFTDQLVRLFSNRVPVLAQLRALGLLALELAPPAKDAVLRQNLGHLGLEAAALPLEARAP